MVTFAQLKRDPSLLTSEARNLPATRALARRSHNVARRCAIAKPRATATATAPGAACCRWLCAGSSLDESARALVADYWLIDARWGEWEGLDLQRQLAGE